MSRTDRAASIVIPTRDRAAQIVRILAHLRQQTLPATEFEVVFVLDGCTDGSADEVRRHGTAIHVRAIEQPQRGRAAACNRGAREAKGEIIVFLDDDMVPDEALLAAHRAAHDDPVPRAVIGAAPIQVGPQDPPVVAYRAAVFDRKMRRLAGSAENVHPMDGYTGNFSIPRGVFLAFGGFDETFATYGNEDIDLLIRLSTGGVPIVFLAAARAVQLYEKDAAALARDTLSEGANAVRLARKQPALLPELYLSHLLRRPRRRRILFELASALAFRSPGIIDRIIRRIEPARAVPSDRLYRRFDLAFDFLYWHGADRAHRAVAGSQDGRLTDWLRSFNSVR